MDDTLEIHTLELGRYNSTEEDLASANLLDCWMYWLLHAHEYEPEGLLKLFPQDVFQQATRTITRISEITTDKAMYDSREKAIRDRQWAMNASFREGKEKGKTEGKIEGEIKLIRTLQEILETPVATEPELQAMSLADLQALAANLQDHIRGRSSS